MIGNDVVDLALSRSESNWQRNGFLDKIFTSSEQILIQNSENQEIVVWILWSRKEAVYKIWNRKSGIRKFNPLQIECLDLELSNGKVQVNNEIYYTKSDVNAEFIHSIAVFELIQFENILLKTKSEAVENINGIPFYKSDNSKSKIISKSNHGRFDFIVELK